MRKATRRIVISMFMFFAMVMGLAGCAEKQQNSEIVEEQRENIVIWSYYETKAQQDGLDWLVENFNISQNKYTASWEYVPMTDFTKKLAMAYTEEDLPDIALLDNPNMMDCIQMGMCEDITDFLTELNVTNIYYPATVEAVTYENRMYGLPAVCNNLALIYNKQMLAEAGVEPPQTWDELMEAAKVLTNDTTKGFLLSAKEGEQGAFQLLPWILSADEPTDNIGGSGTIKAFSYLNDMMEAGYLTKNCVNLSQTDVATAFINGETAIMENGPWILDMLENSDIDYGICRLPKDEKSVTIVGGEDFAVMKGKNLEGAKAFFRFYDSNEVMAGFCKKTCVIPTKYGVSETDNKNMDIFRAQMSTAVVRSSIPHWNNMSDRIPDAFYKMVSGEKNPQEAAEYLKVD